MPESPSEPSPENYGSPLPDGGPLDAQDFVLKSGERAYRNLRAHSWRALIRVSLLLLSDLIAVALVVRLLSALASYTPLIARALALFHTGGLLLGTIIGLILRNGYGAGDRRRASSRIIAGATLGTAMCLWESAWRDPGLAFSAFLLITASVSVGLMVLRRILNRGATLIYGEARRPRRAIFVGPLAHVYEAGDPSLLRQPGGFEVLRVLDDEFPPNDHREIELLRQVMRETHADTIVVCGAIHESVFAEIVRIAITFECLLVSVEPSYVAAGVQPEIEWRFGRPLLVWRAPALRMQHLALKRALDLAVSGILLVVLSPVLLAIWTAIRLESRGDAVFSQLRLGRHGRTFRCYKFRSMHRDAEARLNADPALYQEYVEGGFKLAAERDTRVTRVGRLLRNSSLDELPQLWNVLVGDMSLVGPRPIVRDELRYYDGTETLFLSLKPGMTGRWQVSGRSRVTYPERARLELDYAQRWSLQGDIEILFETAPAVLFQRGAH